MTAYDGSFGFLLQGVSQQPDRVQPEGHVKELLDALPDPTKGLVTRPGTVVNGVPEFDMDYGTQFIPIVHAGTPKMVAVTPSGRVRVLTYDMQEQIVAGHSSFTDYTAGGNYGATVAGNVVYVFDKGRYTAGAAVVNTDDMYAMWGYAYHLGGQFSRTYTLTLRYADGTSAVGTYTTPDGSTAGDADKATGSYIMIQIRTTLVAHASYKGTTSVVRTREYMSIQDSSNTFEVYCDDGEDNLVMRGGAAKAGTVADIPKYAPHGAIVRVVGSKGTVADDMWFRFTSDVTTTVGSGFGREGKWLETVDPNDGYALTASTMPHILTYNSGGSWTLSRATWEPRRVGNSTTNPIPSFVGKRISDVAEFSGRLLLLSRQTLVASQTDTATSNGYQDFFRKSMTEWLATDPIDVVLAGDTGFGRHFVAYDKNLLVYADRGQYVLSGDSALTPQTISMPLTGVFDVKSNVRPLVAANLVMLPFSQSKYSGVNEIRPTLSVLDTYMDEITKAVPRYIVGQVLEMDVAKTANMLVLRTDGAPNKLWVYTYLWEGNQKVQGAWHTWRLPTGILHIRIWQNTLYIVCKDDDASGGSPRPTCLKMNLDDAPTLEVNVYAALDWAQTELMLPPLPTPPDYEPSITSGFSNLRFLCFTANADYLVGTEVTPTRVESSGSEYEYFFAANVPGVMYSGVQIVTEITLSEPKVIDWRGKTKTNCDKVVEKYVIDYEDSGFISGYSKSPYFNNNALTYVWDNSQIPLMDDPADGFGTKAFTGKFDLPWGYDPKQVDCTLRSQGLIGIRIVEIRWYGEYFENRI